MEATATGFEYPSMIQQFYNPKSARGSRLGRGPALASTMVQYGSAGAGSVPNITVSPTFSDIGNPFVSAGGLEVGDIALSAGGGGTTGGTGTNRPRQPRQPNQTPGTDRPQRPGGRTRGGGGREGGGREGGGREEVGTTLNVSRALREAMREGQSKNPRVTRSELKSIYKESGLGAEGFRDFLYESKQEKRTPLGDKAYDFLNRQLGKVGAKPIPEKEVIRTPDPRKKDSGKKATPGVVGLINKAGVPGTTNLRGPSQPPANKKSDAKKKAEAKSSKKKK